MHVKCTPRRPNVHEYVLGQFKLSQRPGLPSANRPHGAGPLSFDGNFECETRAVLSGTHKFILMCAAIELAFHTHGRNELALFFYNESVPFFGSRVVWSKCNPNRFRDIQRLVPPGEVNGKSAYGVPQRVQFQQADA